MLLQSLLLSLLTASCAWSQHHHHHQHRHEKRAVAPSAAGLCDKYAQQLFGNNTDSAQLQLMIYLVNTAEAGNWTTPNNGITVNGVLNDGTYKGQAVSLFKYFDGSLKDSNTTPLNPNAVNWADDGGQAPLRQGLTSYHVQSNQASLITHLYQFFGSMLGCSTQGTGKLGKYAGHVSMFDVHKYMSLDRTQINYHNEQFRLAALSLGFTRADATTLFNVLQYFFNAKCLPASTQVAANGPQLHSVCTDATCPSRKYSDCTPYPNGGVFPDPGPA